MRASTNYGVFAVVLAIEVFAFLIGAVVLAFRAARVDFCCARSFAALLV